MRDHAKPLEGNAKIKITAETLLNNTIEAGPIDLAALSASIPPSQPLLYGERIRKCETRSRSKVTKTYALIEEVQEKN